MVGHREFHGAAEQRTGDGGVRHAACHVDDPAGGAFGHAQLVRQIAARQAELQPLADRQQHAGVQRFIARQELGVLLVVVARIDVRVGGVELDVVGVAERQRVARRDAPLAVRLALHDAAVDAGAERIVVVLVFGVLGVAAHGDLQAFQRPHRQFIFHAVSLGAAHGVDRQAGEGADGLELVAEMVAEDGHGRAVQAADGLEAQFQLLDLGHRRRRADGAAAHLVEEGELAAGIEAGVDVHILLDRIQGADGVGIQVPARVVGDDGTVGGRHAVGISGQRIGRRRRRARALEGQAHVLRLVAGAGVDLEAVRDLPLVGRVDGAVVRVAVLGDAEGAAAGEALGVGGQGAVVQLDLDGLALQVQQDGVAQVPHVVGRVVRGVAAHGQRVVGHDFLGEAQLVGEVLQVFLDYPQAFFDGLRVGVDGAAAVDVDAGGRRGQAAGGRRQRRVAVGGGDEGGALVGEGGRRRAAEHGDGVLVALEIDQLVAHVPAVHLLVEVEAEGVVVGAAAVGQVALGAVRQREEAGLVAHRRPLQRVDARIGAQRAARRQHHGHGRVEGVLVAQRAGVEGHFAVGDLVGQRGRDGAAVVGREAGIADAVVGAVEAADRAVPAVGDLAAEEGVVAHQSAVAGGHAQRAFRRVVAVLEDEVHRRARLAIGQDHAGAAAQDLGALDGVVDAEGGVIGQEGQRRRREQWRAVQLQGHVGRVAAGREAADLDVGAGLAARRFDVDARGNLHQVGGAGGHGFLELLGRGRRDGKGGIDLADGAAGGDAGDDHLLHVGGDGVLGGGGGRGRGGFIGGGRRGFGGLRLVDQGQHGECDWRQQQFVWAFHVLCFLIGMNRVVSWTVRHLQTASKGSSIPVFRWFNMVSNVGAGINLYIRHEAEE